jgi:DNA polymerase III subunit beta
MKFIINREHLLIPLLQIVNVIEKRQTMPILANVLLVIKDNSLVLTGTDLEIQVVSTISIDTEIEGRITVPARKFLDICRSLPNNAEIKLELHENKLKINSARSRFTLSSLPADDYPEFVEGTFDCQFSINAGRFKKALDKTIFCMANQDVRYYLNGLMLNISNNRLKLVASDGHRLSFYEDEINQQTGYEASIIIPRKGILELSRLIDNPDIELTIQFSKNNIRIFINNLIFSAKLIDAKYPDFSKIFHQDFLEPIEIEKITLKDALTRVAILANEKFKGISFDISTDCLSISTHNPEHEEAEEELAIKFEGEKLSIAFNVQYLLDAVGNIDSEISLITISQNASCCFIEDPNDDLFKFIVMPMLL